MRFAWLLMLVYLPMMTAITFHHHSEAEGASVVSYCYDCEHHIHHDGHLTASKSFAHDCVLCQLHRPPSKNKTKVLKISIIEGKYLGFRYLPLIFCVYSARSPSRPRSQKWVKCFPISLYVFPKAYEPVPKKQRMFPKKSTLFPKNNAAFPKK